MRTLKLTKALLAVSSTLLLTAACSGGGDGGNGSVAIAELCAPSGGAFVTFVDKVVECTPAIELFLGQIPSDAEVADACTAQLQGYSDDGSIILQDQAGLDACLAAINAADCETFEIDNIPACNNLFEGTLELGSACESDDQCAGDAYCDQPSESCGSCVATLADGETCSEDTECTSNKCLTTGQCGPFGESGDACNETEDCVGQLVCDSTCKVLAPSSVGDSCTDFTQCGFPASSLFCNQQAGMCEEFLAVGDDCFDGTAALGTCNLLSYDTCDFADTRKCIAGQIVGLGESCGFGEGLECDTGLVCSGGDNGTCMEQGKDAACDPQSETNTCGLFLECKSDNKCDYENSYSGMCPAL